MAMTCVPFGKPIRLIFLLIVFIASSAWSGALPAFASANAGVAATSQPSPPILPYGRLRPGLLGHTPQAHKPSTTTSCPNSFTSPAATPNATAFNELESVAAIYPTNIWAVGFSNTGATNAPDRTLADHWNGTAWTRVATPNVGAGHNDLSGVAAIDPNDVWAVGNSGPSSTVFKNLALHWNGSAWAAVATPQPSAVNQGLGGVSALASNNVWAVGTYFNGSVLQTLVIHWNGSTWSTVASPNTGSGHNILQGVFARTASDIWAVGQYQPAAGNTMPYATLIEHYDGSTWTIQTSTNVSTESILYSVTAVSPTDAWAVGYSDGGGTTPAQTLTEHLVGTVWTTVTSPNSGTGDSLFTGTLAISSTNVWATGFGAATTTSASLTLIAHWDGSTWTVESAENPGATFNGLFSLAALPGNDVWAVGGQGQVGSEVTMAQQFQLPAPTAVIATAGDHSAAVSWTPESSCNSGFATTGYVVTSSDGCTVHSSAASATSPATLIGLNNGSPYQFTVQAVSASLGPETPSAPSAAVIPNGASVTTPSACSTLQYSYANPNPNTFVDIDATRLKLQFTATAASVAVITGNADLFTGTAGVNQDIGIDVNGALVAWKESGGFAGIFSPNAAAVQAFVPLTASTAYTVKLQWKSNKAVAGSTIYAGAGPLEGDFRFSAALGYSPTRLSVRIVPVSVVTVYSAASTGQYQLNGSNGTTFADIDSTNLSLSVPVTAPATALITGNADLFTANAGYNQDIAVNVDGSVAAWKESGGFGGTFSPNAAYVQAVVPLTTATHTVTLQWKTNKPEGTATIYAGAGPLPATTTYSPTRITVAIFATPGDVVTKTSTAQYSLVSSDGAGWTALDSTNLTASFQPGTLVTSYTYQLSGNVDLFTANAGYNQDIGIFISGGVYGSGTLVAWKESGGFAGTFSPNAAYVETLQRLDPTVTYTVWLAWKANKQAAGKTIYAGAGPWPSLPNFSPTTLSAVELSFI
jgi:Fibronectin type III domain